MEKYYTPIEVAEMLSLTRETIYTMIKEDRLKAYKFGRSVRISEAQLKEALQAHA